MGLIAESTIPKNLRWIPRGMDISYEKKSTGVLTATSQINPDTFFTLTTYPGEVQVPIIVTDIVGNIVTKANIRLWISQKPDKKK